MPSPLEMMIQAAGGKPAPIANGDQAQMAKQMQAMQQQQKEQQVFGQFQQSLEQRLNPRIGTMQDADPQFNPIVQLMMKLRGGMQAGQQPMGAPGGY